METNVSAEKSLSAALNAFDALTPKSAKDRLSGRNAVVARNVLHEELGYIGERRDPYHLDDDTRDILLAHARQDTAHALINSVSTLRELQSIQRRLGAITFLAATAVVLVILDLVANRWA